jgi:hypothetical protein
MNDLMKTMILGSFFTAAGAFASGEVGPDQWPIVEEVDSVNAVSFFGTNYMESSFDAPPGIVLANPFSIDIVMYNPSVVAHEGLISWTDRVLADATAQYFKFGCGTGISRRRARYYDQCWQLECHVRSENSAGRDVVAGWYTHTWPVSSI